MTIEISTGEQAAQARSFVKILAKYREPDHRRSLVELAVTAIPLVALWVLAWYTFAQGYWWTSLLLTVPAAGFLVRLFMIQHDCGHGAFFRHRRANDWTGRIIGVLTMTPYDFWRHSHAVHHSTCGNLDQRGIGDVDTLTLVEYLERSRWGRLKYRLYRHPLILFGFGPAYLFILHHRLPFGFMRKGLQPWVSTQATNAAMGIIAAALIWFIGIEAFLLVHLPIMLLASSAGVWLFFVQHQFEDTFWSESNGWTFHEAALHGSSHYDLPPVLRWFTANIGVHHVHHLSSRIPFYRLPSVLREHPELGEIGRLSLLESLRCVRLVLWDENHRKLISFREAKQRETEIQRDRLLVQNEAAA
ncbi:omega-6 fatty acid desaturase (delta-12 desaturase) [Rhodoligotrophos appendicifer]|uniref:fatty acid desaturase n=1 Tax=Rhodoligotrophos appendicifer TaxID=987056 RepID=UPI0011856DF7|nr:fatty acid desaturase [Rhodoligotrophos appendicifer]